MNTDEIKAYYRGYRSALFNYAVWKDGAMSVGMGREYSQELRKVEELEQKHLSEFELISLMVKALEAQILESIRRRIGGGNEPEHKNPDKRNSQGD